MSMHVTRSFRPALLAGVLLSALPSVTAADVVFQTNNPFGGFLGLNGFDVFQQQSVAARFVPTAAHTFDRVSIWFMSNDFDGTTPQVVTVSLRADNSSSGTSIPSGTILESWTVTLPIVGWDPQLIPFDSTTHTPLVANTKYWIVAESALPPFVDPIWCWSGTGNEYTATNQNDGTGWSAGNGAAVAFVVEGTPAGSTCRADFNNADGVTPQDIFDFLNAWFAADPSADFNAQNGITPQDIFDFLNAWFAGC